MIKKWQSNASWTNKGYEHTCETHYTKEEAQGVCNLLIEEYKHGMPCEYRGECLHAWVTEIKEE